jgi:RNA polymerase sigma-70 factor (ECF subfamily)
LLKARYKAEFDAGIRAVFARMPDKDRTLLVLHLVHGVSLPRLAAMHRVSRPTIARWLAAARRALHDDAQRELEGRLRVSPSELDSIAALVRSQVEISVVALAAGIEERGHGAA